MTRRPPIPTLFPYTTLFRSRGAQSTTCGQQSFHHKLETKNGYRRAEQNVSVRREARPARDDGHRRWRRTRRTEDRKSTRLNSSHMSISYAVFCLKKKKKNKK